MLPEILPHVISGFALAVVGWGANHMRTLKTTIHDLELRMVRAETQAGADLAARSDLKEELADIRENMVRRDDLVALRDAIYQRIQDLRPRS